MRNQLQFLHATLAGRILRASIVAIVAISPILVGSCAQSSPATRPVDLLTTLAKAQQGKGPEEQRAAMVDAIRADLRDAAASADTPQFERALSVIGALPREQFVSRSGRAAAYVDLPQSIGYGQTISDPYVVALMTGQLELPDGANVLDIGTGSGYQAAVLARIARRVYSIEIVRPLAVAAAARLRRLGFSNIEVRSGDGFAGWPERAPFDGIVVAASATAVPAPLLSQLKPGGRLIMPIGSTQTSTQLLRVTKGADGTTTSCSLGRAVFVPLTGPRALPFAQYGLADRSIPLCFGRAVVGLF